MALLMQAVDQLNLDDLRVAIDKDDDSRPASAHPIRQVLIKGGCTISLKVFRDKHEAYAYSGERLELLPEIPRMRTVNDPSAKNK